MPENEPSPGAGEACRRGGAQRARLRNVRPLRAAGVATSDRRGEGRGAQSSTDTTRRAQQLGALTLKAVWRGQLAADKPKPREPLNRADTQHALEDLRDLARGIYPPLLADKGLPAALTAQARKVPIPTRVATDGVGRLEPEVEATIYFCTLEALQNVTKYARASTVDVSLRRDNGVVEFTIADDGHGFDPARRTSGGPQAWSRVEAVAERSRSRARRAGTKVPTEPGDGEHG